MMKSFKSFIPAIAVLTAFFPSNLNACAVCFGGADGNLIKGFTWGVAFLAILPFLLMAALIAFIIKTARRNQLPRHE
jgi:hypothetical protein